MRFTALLLMSVLLPAADVYVTQSGNGDGTNCDNARSLAWLNDAANWGGGGSDIMPGDTVHLCGMFTGAAGTTAITVQSSGSVGNPITILFEAGALLSAPYWGSANTAAIQITGQSYITIDGGSNGVVRNTANGTGLTYHAASIGVRAENGSNITVRNLTISDFCQHTSTSDEVGCDTGGNNAIGIVFMSVTDSVITQNSIDDVQNGVWSTGTGALNLSITANTISRCNWGIAAYSGGAPVISALVITGNNISDASNWDTALDTFHHNGIYLYGSPSGSGFSNVVIANNYIHGTMSACSPNSCATSWIYLAKNLGTITGTTFYNNVLVNGASVAGPGNCYITDSGSGSSFYNNTVNGNGFGGGICTTSSGTLKNNVVANVPQFVSATAPVTVSNNVFMAEVAGGCDPFLFGGGPCSGQATFAAWQSATGGDSAPSGYFAGNTLSASGTPQIGSPVIGNGANLTALGISALNTDAVGVSRPAVGPWDIGAYQWTPSRSHSHAGGRITGGKQ